MVLKSSVLFLGPGPCLSELQASEVDVTFLRYMHAERNQASSGSQSGTAYCISIPLKNGDKMVVQWVYLL